MPYGIWGFGFLGYQVIFGGCSGTHTYCQIYLSPPPPLPLPGLQAVQVLPCGPWSLGPLKGILYIYIYIYICIHKYKYKYECKYKDKDKNKDKFINRNINIKIYMYMKQININLNK